jgi:DNA-binding transcriptional LysR family regulator
MDSTFTLSKAFDSACHLAGLKANIHTQSRSPHTLLALAEAGHGVAIVPSFVRFNRYTLKALPITYHGKPIREPRSIFWDKRRTIPRYMQDFCIMIADHMREVLPTARPSPHRGRAELRMTHRITRRNKAAVHVHRNSS